MNGPDALVTNRPGLDALAHPAGRYGDTLARLLARLSASDYPELRDLLTRAPDDPSLALLDAWACLSEVLSFYHERLLNECYLRPCIERRSAVELARLVGYAPRPGVAADVYLAFTLDDPNKEAPCAVPAGTKAFSQPGVGETMQPFETVESLTGRPRWSAIRPHLTRPQRLAASSEQLYLKGLTTGLHPGDALLFAFTPKDGDPANYELRKVLRIEPEMAEQRTLVLLQPREEDRPIGSPIVPTPVLNGAVLQGLIAPPSLQTLPPEQLEQRPSEAFNAASYAPLALLRSAYPALRENLAAALAGMSVPTPTDRVIVYAMRIKAAPRGHNAPRRAETTSRAVQTTRDVPGRGQEVDTDTTITTTYTDWAIDPALDDLDERRRLRLDAIYDQIAPHSLVVIQRPDPDLRDHAPQNRRVVVEHVAAVATVSPTSYNLPGRVTQLTLNL